MPTQFLQEAQPELVIDVGANRGQFLIDVRNSLPAAVVVAFEPLQTEFEVLSSIHGDDTLTDLRMIAVGQTVGTTSMYLSESLDSSSTLEITAEQENVYPGTRLAGVTTVPVSTLDAQLARVSVPKRSLLKIDVQGGELAVLRGSSAVLPLFEFILVEVSFVELYKDQPLARDVVEFLSSAGFTLDRVLSLSVVDQKPIQADFVFRNGRHEPEVPKQSTAGSARAGGVLSKPLERSD